MPRSYHKSWQDRRPGWRRRVKWYQGLVDIRLNFVDMDEGRERNCFYADREEATSAYERFIAGARVADME